MTREKTTVAATLPHELETPMEWSAEDEIQLLFALDGLKPVGINKHFNMLFISERLSKSLNRDISTETIWTHLRTIYNLEALDEIEPLPFPNEIRDFSLPELEFAVLLSKKRAESEEKRLSDGGSSTDTALKEKSNSKSSSNQHARDMEKKVAAKLAEIPKRSQKRTRGSMSLESSSPSTTPPPVQKRRRI